MGVKLVLHGFTLYGKRIMEALRVTESSLNERCGCPPGQDCLVEIREILGRRLEIVVNPSNRRTDMASVDVSYCKVLERRANVEQVIAMIVRAVTAWRDSKTVLVGREQVRGRVLNFPHRHLDRIEGLEAAGQPHGG